MTHDTLAAELADVRRSLARLDDRLGQLTGLLLEQVVTSEARTDDAEARHQRVVVDVSRQTQALLQLLTLVEVGRPLPPLGGWAAAPDFLLHLVQHVVDRRPAVVLECGSGSTTLLLALAIRTHGLPTRVVSLDHDAYFADQTRRRLAEHGVDDLADVRLAPLVPTGLPDHPTPWYDVAALPPVADLPPAGVLVVDGPPETTGRLARWPAVPLLRDRLAPGCTVLLDDLGRAGEQAAAAAWLDAVPGAHFENVDLLKGLGVLTLP